MTFLRVATASMATLLALTLAAGCTADDNRPTRGASPDSTARSKTVKDGWEKVVPGGDCRCADGSEFSFWDRRADPTRVVLFLNGGGVCWDTKMCTFTSTGSKGENSSYNWSQETAEEPDRRDGILDLTRAGNPFAGYSFMFVSSCTGDTHLGNVSRKYPSGPTVEHRGYVNGSAALGYLAEHYPDAKQVVVIGKTAGSVAAPIYGGLVSDRLPHARVVVLGGQSGAWPDNPDFNADILDTRWGAYDAVPDWAIDGLTTRDWGVPRFWIQAARHNPNLVLARFDFAYDPHASAELTPWTGRRTTLEIIDGNEAAIEAAGVILHSYTAPGADHGIFEYEKFYEIAVNGVRVVDWVKTLVTDAPPADVRCAPCGP